VTTGRTSAPAHAFWRLRQLRAAHGLTLEELAARTGLTKSFLSKVERGLSVPSIGSAVRLADAFGVSVGELFGAEDRGRDYSLIRRADRLPLARRGQVEPDRYEAIVQARTRGVLEAFVDRPPFAPPPGHRPAEHRGQEMIFVVKGRVEVHFPHASVRLGTGDTLIFDGTMPHRVLSQPPRRGEILVIVTADAAAEAPAGPPSQPRRAARKPRTRTTVAAAAPDA